MSKIEVEDLSIPDAPPPKRPAIPGITPSQIDIAGGTITGVDRMDEIARQKLPVEAKLVLMCEEVKGVTGRDPRGGGHAIVARPRVILQLLVDLRITQLQASLGTGLVRMQRPIVISTSRGRKGETVCEADIIGWWRDIPIAVRSSVVDDNLHCLPLERIPESKMIDRQRAGQLRVATHQGGFEALDDLREEPARPS